MLLHALYTPSRVRSRMGPGSSPDSAGTALQEGLQWCRPDRGDKFTPRRLAPAWAIT